MISKHHALSVRGQCDLLEVNRSSLYYKPVLNQEDTEHANLIKEIYAKHPCLGYRRITEGLRDQGIVINQKRVRRLMRFMGIEAIYPKPNTSKKAPGDQVFPYLLGNLQVVRPHQVWQVDITYLRMRHGFMYLTALIDVYSRVVVGWNLSNTLQTGSCLRALQSGIKAYGPAEIVNSDQGAQFTSLEWIHCLKEIGIQVSMTGKGRCADNAYIERLWRTFKYEGFYLWDVQNVRELRDQLDEFFKWYNEARPHQSLGYKKPMEVMKMAQRLACGLVESVPEYNTEGGEYELRTV